MRWGSFILGVLGLLAFGGIAGLLVTSVIDAVGKLDEGAGGLLGIVIMAAMAGAFFFLAMASTAGVIVALEKRRES